jgi:dipeptidyl aminopeptidase/acylaminoacyl peptidase
MAGRPTAKRWLSPDGAKAIRPIFTISQPDGLNETRLTTASGHNDGPDFSPDGAWIYFNSERTGQMQIWRMKPDGTAQEQVIFDDTNDWFPHISPDGQWMVFLAYSKGRHRPSAEQGCAAQSPVLVALKPCQRGCAPGWEHH